MGNSNSVPPRPRASSREATGGTENVVVTEAAPSATPSPVVATARKQGRDDVEKETTRALQAGRGNGVGKVVTVKIVMARKDAEALVARLKAQSARERKARMAELKGELRAGSCGGDGGGRDDARRPMICSRR